MNASAPEQVTVPILAATPLAVAAPIATPAVPAPVVAAPTPVLTQNPPASFTSQLAPVPNAIQPGTAVLPHLQQIQVITDYYKSQGLTLEQGLARDAAKAEAEKKAEAERLQKEKDALLDVENGIMKHYLDLDKKEAMPEIDFIRENIKKMPRIIRVAAGTDANYVDERKKWADKETLFNAAMAENAQLKAERSALQQTVKAQEANVIDASSRFTTIAASFDDAQNKRIKADPVAIAANPLAAQHQQIRSMQDWWKSAPECDYIGNR
jgi:hypothetical protein